MPQKQPEDYNTITPYFTLKDANKAIEFYKYVFNVTEESRMNGPDGKIMHAALKIGDSQIMLMDEQPEMPMSTGATKANTYVYVDDPDAAFKRAKEKGAKPIMEPSDQFYGDRMGCFVDPFDQVWSVALHIEDVSDDEINRRAKKKFGEGRGDKVKQSATYS